MISINIFHNYNGNDIKRYKTNLIEQYRMDYANGKIYKITGGGLTYYGSTTQLLSKRMYEHRTKLDCSAKIIIETGEAVIVLVEVCPCKSKEELHMRERFYIENNDCVNKQIPNRTQTEIKERDKQHRIDNVDYIKEQHKQYYIVNKDKVNEKHKQYRIDNANKIKEQSKQYYIDNVDKIKQYRIDNADKIKQYNIDNADKIKEQHKQYHIDNVEKHKQYCIDNALHIKEKRRQRYLKKKEGLA
jgi:hypothetical protein